MFVETSLVVSFRMRCLEDMYPIFVGWNILCVFGVFNHEVFVDFYFG